MAGVSKEQIGSSPRDLEEKRVFGPCIPVVGRFDTCQSL